MYFGKPWQEWIDEYQQSHQHPGNRVLHLWGIPLVTISIVLIIVAVWVPVLWGIAITTFVVGWICQFLGHALEGKPPEFLKDWRFLFVGLRWWFQKVLNR